MNSNIIDFLRNVSDENIIAAKENINSVLAQKISASIENKETEIKNSLYNPKKEE